MCQNYGANMFELGGANGSEGQVIHNPEHLATSGMEAVPGGGEALEKV